MNLKNLTLIGAALLLSAPVFGSTYYGGFEDSINGDYDYNDIVFSLSGNGLKLNSSATFFAQPVVNNNGRPFWDNMSFDGTTKNVGYCIYGGGTCNSGVALDPGAQFLATSANDREGSANDVTFSVGGSVSADIFLKIASYSNTLGYYLLSDSSHAFHALTATSTANVYTFSPSGNFGLIGMVNGSSKFYSQTQYGVCDDVSHFAFFNSPAAAAPEPGMLGLMGAGLVTVGAFFRRRKASRS